MSDEATQPGRLIDLVEYYPNTRGDDVKHKASARYLGVIERASDGFTVLSIKTDDAKRAHNIEVGQVYALTVDGRRTILKTPWGRWRIRSAEIKQLVEGELEGWAAPYFDPASDQYYRRAPDYEDQTDADAERKYRRLILGEAPTAAKRKEPELAGNGGCAVFLALGLFGVLAAAGFRLVA